MNPHGHTHTSFGEVQVGGVSVLNCGPLLYVVFTDRIVLVVVFIVLLIIISV